MVFTRMGRREVAVSPTTDLLATKVEIVSSSVQMDF